MAIINKAPNFEKMANQLIKRLPSAVAKMGLKHFKQSFYKQGFTDYAFVAWVKRKDDFGHKLLRQTNSLMQDLKIKEQTINRIEIGTTLPYAAIHNTGGKFSILITDKMRKFFWAKYYETKKDKWKFMALTKKKRMPIRIPQRQYIGNSQILNNNIDKYIIEQIQKTFGQRQ